MNIVPILLGAGAVFLIANSNKKKTTVAAKPKELPPNKDDIDDPDDYEDFPDEVNVKQNEENIFKYFSEKPYYLTEIPGIYNYLAGELKFFYDPKAEPKNEKSYIFLNPDFAIEVWDYATFLILNNKVIKDGFVIKADTKSNGNLYATQILQKLSPDVYWKEGLIPYKYNSPFWPVYASVSFLTRISYQNELAKKGNNLGLSLPKSIEE